MHSAKHWFSIFFGLFLMAAGVLPILSRLGVIGSPLYDWLSGLAAFFAYLIAFAGLYLIIDSFHEIGSLAPIIGWITLGVGFLVLGFGVLQLLVTQFGVLAWDWWPEVPAVFYYAIFILEGILLFIAGFLD
jgi:hypothetical protein